MSLDVDTFVNGPPIMTTENEPRNVRTTLAETIDELPTSDSQLLASSTNNELLTTTSIYNRQRMSSDSAIAAAAALGAIACLSCFMTSILLVILIIQRRKRNNGKSYLHGNVTPLTISNNNMLLLLYTTHACVQIMQPHLQIVDQLHTLSQESPKNQNQLLSHAQWQATPSMKDMVQCMKSPLAKQ